MSCAPPALSELYNSGCSLRQTMSQRLKWYNWPTRKCAGELCYPPSAPGIFYKQAFITPANSHVGFCILFSSIQARACCILTQLLEWNSVSTFFQSKCVDITNWKYSFQSKGKAAVVTQFLKKFSSMSRQKDLQRGLRERSCKVSHLIINKNHFFGGWCAAENWQSKFIFALCGTKLISGLRSLKFHWLL